MKLTWKEGPMVRMPGKSNPGEKFNHPVHENKTAEGQYAPGMPTLMRGIFPESIEPFK
jgi:hypothetical protein